MKLKAEFEELEPLNELFRKKLKKETINEKASDFIGYFKDHIEYAENIGLGIYLFDYQTLSIHYASKLLFELFGFSKKEYYNNPSKAFITHLHPADMDRVMHLNLAMIEYVNGLTNAQKKKIESRYYYRTIKNKWILQTNRVVEFSGGLYDIGKVQVCSEQADFNAPLYLVLNTGSIRKCILPPASKLSSVELSRREEEVLFWSLRAFGIDVIAEQLNITHAGVRHHRRNILKKFNARSFLEVKTKCGDLISIP